MHVTHDHLSVEPDTDTADTIRPRYRVVAWAADGVPCTVDSDLDYDEATGLRTALKAAIESW
jgi:hypothetical protein